jgi:DNA repair exonuclease SbcCD nuclease subunit
MAKGYLISDIHLGVHRLEEDKWLKIAKHYFYKFFIPTVQNKWEDGDKIFILGDLFDNRNHLSLKVISFALDLFNDLEKMNLPVLIIGGNHDYYNNNDSEHTSLRILEKYKSVEIYTEPHLYEFSGKNILLMPWNGVLKEEQEIFRKYSGKAHYMFSHSELQGAKTNLKVSLRHGVNIADFVAFPKVFSGHIHLYQRIKNFTYLGSPYHIDRNDKGNSKGLTIIDFNNNSEEFIPNTISPEFKTIEINKDSDIEKIDRILKISNVLDEKDDFIDIIINNSVIINNKEVRKKLENLAKRKNLIASIKQIDDITVRDTIEDVDLDNIGIDVSVEDLLREYVIKQNFGTDNKDSILSLLEESIKISKEL